jgi:hypothetical protein
MLATVAYRIQMMDILDRYSTITNDPIAAHTFLLDMFSVASPACPINGTDHAPLRERDGCGWRARSPSDTGV